MVFDNADLKNLPKTWSYRDTSGQRTRHLFFQRHPEALARLPQAHGVFTTHSSAPEVTLFGTPRIALWPVHATTPEPGQQPTEDVDGIGLRTTPYDSKVALIATLGGQRYFVQRSEPGSGENDLEVHADKQNKKIFDYLKRLTDAPFPGYNRPTAGYSTFKEKYAAGGNAQGTDSDRDAMVLSLLDYIRSSNFADGHLDTASQFSTLCKGIEHWGFGQVSPMRTRVTNSQRGTTDALTTFGRMITVSEVALTVVCVAEKMADGSIRGLDDAANRRDLKNVGDRRLEVGFLVEGFVPGEGWTDYRPYASMSLEGGAPGVSPINGTKNWPAMRLNGIALSPETNSARVESTESQRSDWTGFGGTLGVRALTGGVLMFKPIVLPATSGPSLKFTGDSGGSNQLKLAIYDSPSAAGGGNSSLGELVQVIPLVFPDFELATLPTAPAAAEGVAYKLRPRVLEADSKLNKPLLRAGDVVQSLVPLHGDHRLIAARRWVQSQTGPAGIPLFVPHSSYGALAFAHSLQDPAIPETAHPPAAANSLIPDITLAAKGSPDFPLSPVHSRSVYLFPGGWQSFSPNEALDRIRLDSGKRGGAWPHLTGDFDNGTGNGPDGAFLNRPDDGNWAAFKNHQTPYFTASKTSQTGASVPPVIIAGFSAQRILPSPVMFGSLPTGTRSNVPWQTLLFRPDLGGTHYGAKTPPDHLLLDLFWSPVLEPAPISTPLETAGKINVNHALVPFSYIHRSTALHAAMKAETLLAIPDSAGERYKAGPTMTEKFRRYIDTAGTLEIWKRRVFDQNKVFLTPGEICEHPLVPEGIGSDDDDLQKFWSEHRLTGDNSKERPYAHLYPRLTTQSNVFRAHFIAETLTKARSTDPEEFDTRKDKITGRFRGSSVISRHIDTPLAEIPDYLTDTDTSTSPTNTQPTQRLHNLYNWSTSAMEEFR